MRHLLAVQGLPPALCTPHLERRPRPCRLPGGDCSFHHVIKSKSKNQAEIIAIEKKSLPEVGRTLWPPGGSLLLALDVGSCGCLYSQPYSAHPRWLVTLGNHLDLSSVFRGGNRGTVKAILVMKRVNILFKLEMDFGYQHFLPTADMPGFGG